MFFLSKRTKGETMRTLAITLCVCGFSGALLPVRPPPPALGLLGSGAPHPLPGAPPCAVV